MKFKVLRDDCLPKMKNSITVTDNRTGKEIEIPIASGAILATEFQKINLRLFDPSYQNTAVVNSKICEIDGDNGVLRYRGYPIEELAEKSNYLEVSYLLIYGELPSKKQYQEWHKQIMQHTYVHSNVQDLMKSFNYDAHPMGMLISSISAMSTFHPEANPSLSGNMIYKEDIALRNKQIARLLGKVTTIAANCYRHRIGRPYNPPGIGLDYAENMLYMMDHLNEPDYKVHPKLAKALDILFILHADHELNCSTAAMRHVSSSLVDPYSSVAAAGTI